MSLKEGHLNIITDYEPVSDVPIINESPGKPITEIKRRSKKWKDLRRRLFVERQGDCEICSDPINERFILSRRDWKKGDADDNLMITHATCLNVLRKHGEETPQVIAQMKHDLEELEKEPTGGLAQITDFEKVEK